MRSETKTLAEVEAFEKEYLHNGLDSKVAIGLQLEARESIIDYLKLNGRSVQDSLELAPADQKILLTVLDNRARQREASRSMHEFDRQL